MKKIVILLTLCVSLFAFSSCDRAEDIITPKITSLTCNDKDILTDAGLVCTSDKQVVVIDIEAAGLSVWDVTIAPVNEDDDISWIENAIPSKKVANGVGLTILLPSNNEFVYSQEEDEFGDVKEIYTYSERSAFLVFTSESGEELKTKITQSKYAPAVLSISLPKADDNGRIPSVVESTTPTDIIKVTPAENSVRVEPTICNLTFSGKSQTLEIPITTDRTDWEASIVANQTNDLNWLSITPKRGLNNESLLLTLNENSTTETHTGAIVKIISQEAIIELYVSQDALPAAPKTFILWQSASGDVYEYDEFLDNDPDMLVLNSGDEITFEGGFIDNDMYFNYNAVSWNIEHNGVSGQFVYKATENGKPVELLDIYEYPTSEADWLGLALNDMSFDVKPFSNNPSTTESRSIEIEVLYDLKDGTDPVSLTKVTVRQEPIPAPKFPTEITPIYSYRDENYDEIKTPISGNAVDFSDLVDMNISFIFDNDGYGGEFSYRLTDASGESIQSIDEWGTTKFILDWIEMSANAYGLSAFVSAVDGPKEVNVHIDYTLGEVVKEVYKFKITQSQN